MKKRAFTLAEMLIVIGIIGVVAALVIPSLIANYQNRVLMTQLKKAYAEVSQAGLLAIAQEDAGDFKNTKAYLNRTFVDNYFKKAKDCGWGKNSYKECFGSEYKLNGSKYDISNELNENSHCITAKAGYSICLHGNYGILDVNGPKGPNIIGRDAFSVGIGKSGNLDDSYSMYLEDVVRNDWSFEN